MTYFNRISAQWNEIEEKTLPDLIKLLREGPYINGSNVQAFEKEFASWCCVKHAVGVSNGTDGLRLAVQVLNNSSTDIIITAANAFVADALPAKYLGLDLYFVDCDEYYGIDIEQLKKTTESISPNKKIIIIAVHLYGQPCNIASIKSDYPNAYIIEDCSQAAGAMINGKPVGTFGDISVFSLYPTKNLGALGDAGIVVTNNDELYQKIKILKEYGSTDKTDYIEMGWNNRLDEIQALILRHKLPLIKEWNERKSRIVQVYFEKLSGVGDLKLPIKAPWAENHTYHLFPIRTVQRDALKNHLASSKIITSIHYPRPLHRTSIFIRDQSFPKAEEYSKTILSLPIYPHMSIAEVEFISNEIRRFFS